MKSLLKYFEPPNNDYQGYFGLLCGYNADPYCAQLIASRFLNFPDNQYSSPGYTPLVFLLDAHSKLETEMPWLRLLLKRDSQIPYSTLHAKVALLLFTDADNNWLIRLLVCTGNWTITTIENSLDLMWSLDIHSTDIENKYCTEQDCADIKAAWDMLSWIMSFYTLTILQPISHFAKKVRTDRISRKIQADPSIQALFKKSKPKVIKNYITTMSEHYRFFCTCIQSVCKRAKGLSRFFDNREKSFLSQLKNLTKVVPLDENFGTPNYLAMGSGFYESNKPNVPNAIVKTLKECGIINDNPMIELYVNPKSCQCIADSKNKKMIREQGWNIRKPEYEGEDELKRTLHAKFLFSAYDNERSPRLCRNPWVYLGSGNLTQPGFNKAMKNGNLEAGVFFRPPQYPKLQWFWQNEDYTSIQDILPIGWENDDSDLDLESGISEAEPQSQPTISPPVTTFLYDRNTGGGRLLPIEPTDIEYEVILPDQTLCKYDEDADGFIFNGVCPEKVMLKWKENGKIHTATIPIVDYLGVVGKTERQIYSMFDFIECIKKYPLCAYADIDGDPSEIEDELYTTDIEKNCEDNNKNSDKKNFIEKNQYTIRLIMQIVEIIAKKQTSIDKSQWVSWCHFLGEKLQQLYKCNDIHLFYKKYKINPLSALLEKPFRPTFAEDKDTEYGRLYESILTKTEFFSDNKGENL